MFKKLLVPCVCVFLGGAGVAAIQSATAQAWPDSPQAPRWQQECVEFDRHTNVNTLVRQRGLAGWELATAVAAGTQWPVYCFKRPAP